MDRRSFIIGSGAGLVGSGVAGVAGTAARAATSPPVAAPAVHVGPTIHTLSIAGADGESLSWHADQGYRLARAIEATTGRRIRLEPTAETSRADVRVLRASDIVAIDPPLACFAGLPGRVALGAADLAAWLRFGGGQDHVDGIAAAHGLVLRLAGHEGGCHLWAADRDLRLAGREIATQGLSREVARGLGATPTADPAAALVDASPIAALTSGVRARAAVVAGGGLTPHGTTLVLAVTRAAWESLPPDLQAVVDTVADRQYTEAIAENAAHRAAIVTVRGATTLSRQPMPRTLADAIDTVARAVVADTAATSLAARAIDRCYMAYRATHGGAEPVADPPVA